MSFPVSRRIENLHPSDIRLMTKACERVGGINLGQGLGDLPAPALVRDAAIQPYRKARTLTPPRRASLRCGRRLPAS